MTARGMPGTASGATRCADGWNARGRRTAAAADAWYRQPVLWLGLAIFAASLAGCVWMIVLGARHADLPLPTAGGEIMKVPIARPPRPDPPKAAQ